MRHRIKGRRLGRSPSHLTSLKRNLACQLFAHERITTTLAKAKELRPFAERLITLAKKGASHLEAASAAEGEESRIAKAGALHARRRLNQLLGVGGKKKKRKSGGLESIDLRGQGRGFIVIKKNQSDDGEKINIVDKLLNEIGPRFADRPGGYTRIIRRSARRLGDAARTAFIELLGATEETKKPPSVPAPTVSGP